MELLKFIFTDIWHFLGTIILIGIVLEGIALIIKAFISNER
jgi:hypothetical protein